MNTCTHCDRVALHDGDTPPLCLAHLLAETTPTELADGTLRTYIETTETRLHDVTAKPARKTTATKRNTQPGNEPT